MHPLFINQLSSSGIIKAICWTLVHSLWQGLFLAIAGALVVLLTKKHRASFRYNLLAFLFFSFVLTAGYTFFAQLSASSIEYRLLPARTGNQQPAGVFFPAHAETVTPVMDTFLSGLNNYLNRNADLIVTGWFILLVVKLVQTAAGLVYIKRISNRQVNAPSVYWTNRLSQLQSALKLRRRVRLLESAILKVPVAVGWFKPLVLVPAALFTQLSNEQLEAILLHELAHIKRGDYLVNLFQHAAENLFFFNPAVLWISSLIREERENCCDDMAIGITHSKANFLKALVSFQEYSSTPYAMAFPGRKNQLLKRVQRIVLSSNNTLNPVEKAGMVSCCLVVVLLSAFIIPAEKNHLQSANHLIVKSSEKGRSLITPGNEGPAEKAERTSSFIKKPALTGKLLAVKKMDLPLMTIPIPSAKKASGLPEFRKDTSPVIKKKAYKTDERFESKFDFEDSIQFRSEIVLNTNVNLQSVTLKPDSFKLNLPVTLQRTVKKNHDFDSSFDNTPANPDSKPAKGQRKPDPEPKSSPTDPVILDLIKAKVVNESVIKNKENFSYLLSNEVLMVQGIRQDKKLHEAMQKKYLSPVGKSVRSYILKN